MTPSPIISCKVVSFHPTPPAADFAACERGDMGGILEAADRLAALLGRERITPPARIETRLARLWTPQEREEYDRALAADAAFWEQEERDKARSRAGCMWGDNEDRSDAQKAEEDAE